MSGSRVLFGSILMLSLGLPDVAVARGRRIVAVFDIEAKRLRLKRGALTVLSDYLADRVAATGVYKVVPRDQIKKRLVKQKVASFKKCYAQSCQIEIGKELAAQKSLATKVMKIGRMCTVTSTLYDLRTATTERGGIAEGKCSERGIMASINKVVQELTGKRAPVRAVPRPAKAPAVKAVSIRPLVGSASSKTSAPRAASRALDQNVDSWWQEGVKGDGIGQWFRVDWSGEWRVHQLRLIPGYMKYRDDRYGHRWGMNNRLKKIRVELSSGHSSVHRLADRRGWHTITLSAPQPARWLKIVILGVYPGRYKGRRIKDSGICELEVLGTQKP